MGMIKSIFKVIAVSAISTVVSCKVLELYNTYTTDNIARDNLKRKIRDLNPFKNMD